MYNYVFKSVCLYTLVAIAASGGLLGRGQSLAVLSWGICLGLKSRNTKGFQ